MFKAPLISLGATLISGSIFAISVFSTGLLKNPFAFSAKKVSEAEEYIPKEALEVTALDLNNKIHFLAILEKHGCKIDFPVREQKQKFHQTKQNIENSVFTKLENKCFSHGKASLKHHLHWGWSVS